jgi:hypothetical protein
MPAEAEEVPPNIDCDIKHAINKMKSNKVP